jgi:hypothetical protein
MGAFSSVSVIKDKWTSEFNDTLTDYASYVYDSIIKSKIAYIRHLDITAKIPMEATSELTKEITKCAVEFKNTNNLYFLHPGPLIDSVSNLTDTRYSSFFIAYGNLWSQKQRRREVAGKALKITTIVIGIALIATLDLWLNVNIQIPTSKNDPVQVPTSKREPDKDYTKYKNGMTCFYMIYDRQTKKFCYIRKAEFTSDKTDNNTFNPQRVSKQLDILLGYRIKTINHL